MKILEAGAILLENGTLLPKSLVLASEPYSTGWTTISNVRSDFERDISQAGWTFFFLAGEIRATVFGFNADMAIRTAVERLIRNAKALNCNGLQIGQIRMKSFLGLSVASVTAHSRHVQSGAVFAG
jgi:hypothetical protein